MTGHLRDQHNGDDEDEGKTVRTRSRHASCGEESFSSSLSSPRHVPQGASNRRYSLPVALPATTDPSPITPPENQQQPSPAPPSAMVSAAFPAPYHRAWPPACPHRLHVSMGGPPCYLCSVLDVPPKYRKREARGLQRVKEKLMQFPLGALTPRGVGAPRSQSSPTSVYAISEWPFRNVPETALTQEAQVPSSATPGCWVSQERDNPGFDIQEPSGESGRSQEDTSRTATLLPAPAAHSSNDGGPCSSLSPFLFSSSSEVTMSPPPYSPTATATTHLPPNFLPRDSLDDSRRLKCSRHLMCQLLYSFTLAMATSTLVVSFDQPIIIIVSVIFFMTMFIFLPVIALIECLFRMKMERNFRQHIVSLINSPQQPPCINPIVV